MKLAIIDFETAKDLKELGFDWSDIISKYYDKKGNPILYLHGEPNPKDGYILRPEQALVVKWLLEKHNLYVLIEPHFKQWFWEIRQINTGDSYAVYYIIETQRHSNPNAYKTHEEAQLGGIKECIKYLKNETISNK